jgi:hypothetical protein
MDDFEERAPQAGGRLGGCLVQVVSHGAALVLGAVLGVVGARVVEYYSDPDVLSRQEGELSRAELIRKLDASERAYADLLAENAKVAEAQQTEIAEAGKKVVDLQSQVGAKQDEIKVLELKAKKSAGKSAALKKELEAKVAELAALQTQLDTALAEKAKLEEDLNASHEETRVAREETQVAKDETVDARWAGFVSEGIVAICEKGNRNKLAHCKDEVRAAFTSARQSRFKQCVGSLQAQPRLVRVDDKVKDPELPRWSEWMDQESSFTKNRWYVTFCDPTLPEATLSDPAAPAAPAGAADPLEGL